ncbi:MAG: pyridoxal phosphate-dependent aminotransferase, partial [Cyclobacteriaceae bacterium]|nr:pyridoxal phosphate-dependent aminotransferase [Cyclobacteriaceae bacterium]
MNDMLSNRINALEESATIAMARKTRELRAQGIDIISLTLGEPDFKTPRHIQEAAKKAIDEEKYFAYPPVPGYPELRKAIADKLVRENLIATTPEQIVVSNGAKHSIANVLLCLLNPGDEVIVFSPYWVSYVDMIRLAEGIPVIVDGALENGFKVTASQVEKALTGKTKAVLYSSPCNPTGAVFSRNELKNIAGVLSKRKDVYVIADEIYEYINYTGEHVSMGSFPEMKDNTVTVNGFSKGFAMTGWRVGYISGPERLANACTKMQGQFTSGINTIAQRAALAGLTGDMSPTRAMAEKYLQRRDMVLEMLKEIPGFKIPVPEGAFYFFPDVSAYFGKSDGRTTITSAHDLCMYILDEAHVSTVSGEAFGAPDCLRLSYAASDDDLKKAI